MHLTSEHRFRLRVVQAGVGVTAALAIAGGVYVALTWEQPHRAALLTILGLAACDATVVFACRFAISRSPHVELLFAGWNAAHVLAGATAAALDEGAESPFVAILFVSIAFAAVSLPRLYAVAFSAFDLAALLGTAAVAGNWKASLVFQAASLVAVAGVCATIAREREERLQAVQEARLELLRRLARVIEFRDYETAEHVERMSEYSALVAAELGWDAKNVEGMRLAASMHDIGKVAVPDSILLKPGPLTDEERELMQTHTVVGWQMLSASSNEDLNLAAQIALSHHERFDGTGYPLGLKAGRIPLPGRIVAVADVFDALTSDRVYRPALSLDDALDAIRSSRGTHFDPTVVDAFERALGRILEVRERRHEREGLELPAAMG